ncbi:PEP-CTERM sorting domain-containing protein [Paludisphaera mucosa]|uniref:PEP-CTERM sorting domain-containing protein n=1 Tax=Paludisphaera mucosa TaxID=3030827 RepID=A0ABT6FCI8_9BACT|nr:PEP-CTERM sorting domain-containing protein [Paludisphaera mucosa]MDG3005304.1 PEP-CTERM sorting domain-containing protein [Paludisphaera mucosa]
MRIRFGLSAILFLTGLQASVDARADFHVQVDYNDPSGSNAAYYDRITAGIDAAAAEWGRYLDTRNETLEIQLNFTNEPTGSGGSFLYGYDADVSQAVGLPTFEAGAAMKLMRGIDITQGADAVLNIGRDWLENVLWYNPDPGSSTPPPPGQVDSHYFFLHELGHILGFSSFRDPNGDLPRFSDGTPYQSTFDALSGFDSNGDFYYLGENAMLAYGGKPVPLTYGNFSHVGNGWWTGRPGVDLVNDVMNGVVSQSIHYSLSGVDVGVLSDMGYSLTAEGRALVGLAPTAVPEPASLLALGLGLAGVRASRSVATRRRRAA